MILVSNGECYGIISSKAFRFSSKGFCLKLGRMLAPGRGAAKTLRWRKSCGLNAKWMTCASEFLWSTSQLYTG